MKNKYQTNKQINNICGLKYLVPELRSAGSGCSNVKWHSYLLEKLFNVISGRVIKNLSKIILIKVGFPMHSRLVWNTTTVKSHPTCPSTRNDFVRQTWDLYDYYVL